MGRTVKWSATLMLVLLLVVSLFGRSGVGSVWADTEEKNGESSLAVIPPATIIYNLYATDGYMHLADGKPLYVYGYVGGRQGVPFTYLDRNGVPHYVAGGPPAPTGGPIQPAEAQFAGNAQVPAPLIYCRVGDVVEIRLKNLGVTNPLAPNDPHTIHLHGLDVDAANDGVPETSIAAIPANDPQPGAGNVVVYMFSVKQPGTYMYHCHQEADIHVQMGMYGMIAVYNRGDAAGVTGPGKGVGGNLWGFKYDKDIAMLLTEIDERQHVSEEFAALTTTIPFNPVDYHPRYWLINGLSFPNTIHLDTPGFITYTNWISAYTNWDPLIIGSAGLRTKVLVRMVNLGFETQPMHIHGFHPKLIGMDQRPWTWGNLPTTPTGKGLELNTFLIGSGNTMELLIDFGAQKATSTYPPAAFGVPASLFAGGTQTRYNPVNGLPQSNTITTSVVITDPFTAGNPPFIGGPVVSGVVGLGPLLGQVFPWHNHDDYKATNDGAYPGGQFTALLMTP